MVSYIHFYYHLFLYPLCNHLNRNPLSTWMWLLFIYMGMFACTSVLTLKDENLKKKKSAENIFPVPFFFPKNNANILPSLKKRSWERLQKYFFNTFLACQVLPGLVIQAAYHTYVILGFFLLLFHGFNCLLVALLLALAQFLWLQIAVVWNGFCLNQLTMPHWVRGKSKIKEGTDHLCLSCVGAQLYSGTEGCLVERALSHDWQRWLCSERRLDSKSITKVHLRYIFHSICWWELSRSCLVQSWCYLYPIAMGS